jgi:steroid delta-isomerase-like uncharacterized protein
MSTEDNKAIVRRATEEFYNQGNIESVGQFYAATYVHHDPASPQVCDRDGLAESLRAFRTGCPDLFISTEELMAEGDLVTKRWTIHATHTGVLSGMPPTGKHITVNGLELFRLVDGKIVEAWLGYDNLSMMHQLGVIPTPEQAVA